MGWGWWGWWGGWRRRRTDLEMIHNGNKYVVLVYLISANSESPDVTPLELNCDKMLSSHLIFKKNVIN